MINKILAVNKEPAERPSFYVSEQSQQRKFTCLECNEFNDILGQHNIVRNHAGTTHAEILLKEHTDEKIETASI